MDIRQSFLDFFASKGHSVTASSPLVPEDATLLFTNAGMVPFKPIFTGEVPAPTPPRATSSQTCIRAGGKHNDLENVGFTARHHTFFEMLGNFSFGDYFKQDAIDYAWEFVTGVIGLPQERLWITVHDSDDEAEVLWQRHVPLERIVRMGDKDNFWQMGDTGPCGPCSEIHYDQGSDKFNSSEDYLGGEGDRFLEIWNLVFMQYERKTDGTLVPLPKPSIDTGMGLERITAIKEGKISNYDSSLFMPLIHTLETITKRQYEYDKGASFRVIADHIRSCTFLLAQGVNFDKEGRGYVLRRILRRAVRHGYLLGQTKPFMYQLVETVVELMGKNYPYLVEKSDAIKELMRAEEERFFATIALGMALFEEEKKNTTALFSGDVAFKLYDTYGFPLDLTQDMLKGTGITLDEERFNALMAEQRARSQANWKGSGDLAQSGDFKTLLEKFGKNQFDGYHTLELQTTIMALLDENFQIVESLEPNRQGWVMLETTPFYAQSGGQMGDKGALAGVAEVLDTQKFFELNLSCVQTEQVLSTGMVVHAVVGGERGEIAKHHSATHLLHAVLRQTLGEHIAQAGSLVETTRLRFDFSHPKALSVDELESIEQKVNDLIGLGISGTIEECSIDDAKSKGAMALFGEKYGSTVRVVGFGDESLELCGGCHVDNTAHIGSFFILKESGVSAGVRRIEAVAGKSAYAYAKGLRQQIQEALFELKATSLMQGLERQKNAIKELKSINAELKKGVKLELQVHQHNTIALVVQEIGNGDIKEIIDNFKNEHEQCAIMLFQMSEGKVAIAAGCKGVSLKAGDWVKQAATLLGGGGGGRPDFATAGGKDGTKIPEAIEKSLLFAHEQC